MNCTRLVVVTEHLFNGEALGCTANLLFPDGDNTSIRSISIPISSKL